MISASKFVTSVIVSGLLVILPTYLAILLLLKLMKTMAGLMRPIAALLPTWVPAEGIMSLLLLLTVCFIVGLALRTRIGREVRERVERRFLRKLPGYSLFNSLTDQLTSKTSEKAWKPALAEIEEALVPAFIIEELEDGRYTVFVPSVPTPLAGSVYILSHDRVHLVDVPFIRAIKTVSRWGEGAKDLLAAMKT